MTPAMLAQRMWTTRRGVGALVGLLMAVIGLLLYAILTMAPAQMVEYGSQVIQPERSAYCPGETMRYPVRVSVRGVDLPVIWHVVEAWQREGGVVLQSTAVSYEIPLVRPLSIDATASRTVPDLAPGVYWLNHVAQSGEATAYTVGPVTIQDCP